MASLNKVLLIGNLTRDPEVRMLPSGNPVCSFGLAVSRNFKDAEGNNRDETAFVDCECFGRKGEAISRFFTKGRPIFVEGRLKLDQWESQTGEKRSKLRVVVDNFEFVDSKQDADRGYGGSQPAASAPAPAQQQPAAAPAPAEEQASPQAAPAADADLDEDVPF